MDKRIVAMATFPPRREGLIESVHRLLPQCDVMHVYLNGYSTVPTELPKDPKLDLILAGPGCRMPDMGSHGKFYWIGDEPGYYCSVDDDILYPPDYIESLVVAVEKYGRKAIVGYHGGTYRVPNGGALPDRGFTRDVRTLYGYSQAVPRDMPVHLLGAGVMASYPKAIGLTTDAFNSTVGSGDDEDVSLFSQRTGVPLVRLAGKKDWIRPNDKQWMIEPLHRRTSYIRSGDDKLRSWKNWRIIPLPLVKGTPVTPVMPVKVVQPSAVPKPKIGPHVPSFDNVNLTTEDLAFTNKILSSDALAAQLVTRIKNHIPTSVIRMSDGERAIIEYSKSGRKAGFLLDPAWLCRYGLTGIDLAQVGRDLLWAGEKADYLACTISGVFWDCFRAHNFFPQRKQFVDSFYPNLMLATDRVGALLKAGPVLVLHRDHERIVAALSKQYGIEGMTGMRLSGWADQAELLNTVPSSKATTVLLSGGASGKPFAVRLANATGKTVLDIGEALGGTWCTSTVRK